MNLEEIRARAEAATEGPWRRVGTSIDADVPLSNDGPPTTKWNTTVVCSVGAWKSGRPIEVDAEFIAHARTDIPNLLALVDALTAENARLRRELDANEGAEDARLAVAEAREEKLTTTLDAVRRLCQSYTPDPPPLFRNPTSQHGEGYNHGTRDMAEAILGVLNGEEES